MSGIVVGVDGGGSKTRALVARADGVVIGEGTAGASNHHTVGEDAARASILGAMKRALADAGVPEERPAAACLGLAGLDEPSDLASVERWANEMGLAGRVQVVHDTELVLAAGTPSGEGIALIAGTGSVCVGKTRDGEVVRAGGWGWLLGDEGSGFDIGARALRLATQTADGRASAHAILEVVLDTWGLDAPIALIHHAYALGTATRAEVARLARPMIALAEENDVHAQRILEAAAEHLARLVRAVAQRLPLALPPLAMSGGLLRASVLLRQTVLARAPDPIGPVALVDDPAEGALTIASRSLR